MKHPVEDIFDDPNLVLKIQTKLPKLFQIAELESQRAGKTGMEVGSLRERILIALFLYKFGENNVNTEIPITETEIDVMIKGVPLSIKTKSGTSLSGVKSVWTVDRESVLRYLEHYTPSTGIIFVQIVWGGVGGLFFFPLDVQKTIFKKLGKENYLKVPKVGTNPRGVEFSSEAISEMMTDKRTRVININWDKNKINYNPFNRWVDLWAQE